MNKKIIGYTTGVFDLFHVGHLNILENAKKHCDVLVVGVTTDELAYKLKNKIPIIPFKDRLELINSIKFIDKVIPEKNVDKFKAWEKIKFDVIFKGSDWKGTEKWNEYERKFKEVGVKVFYFPYTEKISSSIIRKRLLKRYAEEFE